MCDSPLDRMQARARAVRTRAAIRRWQYRQRNLAAGVWFRVRRVLAEAAAAYVISDDDARRLVAHGYTAERCGAELAPEKTIIFVQQRDLADLASRQRIPVGLGPAFLAAPAVALVRVDDPAEEAL